MYRWHPKPKTVPFWQFWNPNSGFLGGLLGALLFTIAYTLLTR